MAVVGRRANAICALAVWPSCLILSQAWLSLAANLQIVDVSSPWKNYNKTIDGKASSRQHPVLTVRLALFYLSLLARYSPDTSIGYDYPPLDSWTETDAGFVHNSTGKTVAQRPQNATVVDRPASAQGSRSSSATRSQHEAGGGRASSATRGQHEGGGRASSATRSQHEAGNRASSATRGQADAGTRSANASCGDSGNTGHARTAVRFATGTTAAAAADPAGGPAHTTHAAGVATPAPHGSQGGGLPARSRQTGQAGPTGSAGHDGTGGLRRSARTATSGGGAVTTAGARAEMGVPVEAAEATETEAKEGRGAPAAVPRNR